MLNPKRYGLQPFITNFRKYTYVRSIPERSSRDLGRNLGRNLSRNLGRDLGRDLGQDLGRDLGRTDARDYQFRGTINYEKPLGSTLDLVFGFHLGFRLGFVLAFDLGF